MRTSAPARAGIVGNPTDMYGGAVLSCAVDARAWCEVTPSDTWMLETSGTRAQPTVMADFIPKGDRLDIVRHGVRALFRRPSFDESAIPLEPLHIAAGTDVPESAGLAGSSALLTAIVAALSPYFGIRLQGAELAELVGAIEYHQMGVVCGYQDFYMAALGGLNFMTFVGKEQLRHESDGYSDTVAHEPMAKVESLTPTASLPLVLAYTGVSRHSGGVHQSLRQRWEQGDRQARQGIAEIVELAHAGKSALLQSDWPALAATMNRNHEIVRALGGSGDANEALIEAALKNGSLGGKLAGAGGGGTVIAVTLDCERTETALREAGAARILHLDPAAKGATVDGS